VNHDGVPIHLEPRRDWDEIAQRLRGVLDECVPQILDRDYITVGEDAQNIIEGLVGTITETHGLLAQGLVELAVQKLSHELKEIPYYLRAGEAVGGRTALPFPSRTAAEERP